MASNKFSLARGMAGNQPRLEELKLAAIKTAYTGNVVTEVHYVLEGDVSPIIPLVPGLIPALEWAIGHISGGLPTFHPYMVSLRETLESAREAYDGE